MFSSFKKHQLITESWRRFINEDKANLEDPIALIDDFSAKQEGTMIKGIFQNKGFQIEYVKKLYDKLKKIFGNKDLLEKFFAPGPYQTIERLQSILIKQLDKDVEEISNNVDEQYVGYNPFLDVYLELVKYRKNKTKDEIPEEIKEQLSVLLHMLKSDQEQDFSTLQSRAIPVINVLIDNIEKNKYIDFGLKNQYIARLGQIKKFILGSGTQIEFLEKSSESLKMFDIIDFPDYFGGLDKTSTNPSKFLEKISELLPNIDYFNYDTSKLELLLRTVNNANNQINVFYRGRKAPEKLANLIEPLSVFLDKLASILKGINSYKQQASKTGEFKGKPEKDVVDLYNQMSKEFKESNKDVYEIASKVFEKIKGYIVMRPQGPARSPFDPPESPRSSPPPLERGYGLGPIAIAESKKSNRRR